MRRELPWVRIDKPYEFETDEGTKTLAELFDGRSQLLVYHFMFGPDWEAGCEGCSLVSDHFDGGMVHLNQRDVTMVCVSRAPLDKINAYKRRMGWRFPWVSSLHGDFNTFYQLLDRAPKGRDEEALLQGEGEWWWRRHDEYENG